MSNTEIKSEINKVLDTLPDKALAALLVFLNDFETKKTVHLSASLPQILKEDRELLSRLAQ